MVYGIDSNFFENRQQYHIDRALQIVYKFKIEQVSLTAKTQTYRYHCSFGDIGASKIDTDRTIYSKLKSLKGISRNPLRDTIVFKRIPHNSNPNRPNLYTVAL